jgi:hypothetical protein
MPVVFSLKDGPRAVIRVVGNTTVVTNTYMIAANSTANSDIGNTDSHPVRGGSITKVVWSAANNVSIVRGSNTVLTLVGSGWMDLREIGMPLNEYSTANLTITINGIGCCLLEVTKEFDGTNPSHL